MKVGKTNGDRYREARLSAATYNESLATLFGAAEALGVESESVGRWERDEVTPSNLNVRRMAQCYNEPLLLENYCAYQCPIGIGRVSAQESRPFSQLAISLYMNIETLETDLMTLFRIAEDGKVDRHEADQFRMIVSKLDKVRDSIRAIDALSEKTFFAEGGKSQAKEV